MRKRILLLSKDAFGKFYLPAYGNQYWKTPNIDELADHGTLFNRHYTSAPSSNMSYYGMFTGRYPMESKMKTYRPLSEDQIFKGESLFDKAEKLGYQPHIVWDTSWYGDTVYAQCYGKHTIIHNLDDIKQAVGVHSCGNEPIHYNEAAVKDTCRRIINCIEEICNSSEMVFIWMHLPHVLYGCTGYGADINWFDYIVGEMRRIIGDEGIYITADHGNMNGAHGKMGYGFDVNEEASSIPLITPRVENRKTVDFPTSNIDLYPLIFDGVIEKREFVFSDSAYYAQLHRKLSIVHGRYKYIYSALEHKEYLYDVIYDPYEHQNLIYESQSDPDRKMSCNVRDMYFYPYWDDVAKEKEILREELRKVWRKPNRAEYARAVYEHCGKYIMRHYRKFLKTMKEKCQRA